jgi:hypothetical protein
MQHNLGTGEYDGIDPFMHSEKMHKTTSSLS